MKYSHADHCYLQCFLRVYPTCLRDHHQAYANNLFTCLQTACSAGAGASKLPLHAVGMLVVDTVVPDSPADGVLEPGDVLVRINVHVVTHFLHMEALLDDCVGTEVQLQLERGGKPVTASLAITNLHSVTPCAMLEVAGGSLHALSYQQARNNRAVVGQVYVAESGYMFSRAGIPKHAIITSLQGKPTPDLCTFASVLRGLSHGARVPLEYFTFGERHRRKSVLLHVDRQWYGLPLYWTRDDAAGAWHATANYPPDVQDGTVPIITGLQGANQNGLSSSSAAAAAVASVQVAANGVPSQQQAVADDAASSSPIGVAAAAAVQTPAAGAACALPLEEFEDKLRCSLCVVDVDIPLVALADGVHCRSFAGNGVVVYHGNRIGLVVVDRNTIAIGSCDVNISFGAHPAEVAGVVRFLHPLHNFAIVSYQLSDLPEVARAKIRPAVLLPAPALTRGDSVRLVGLTKHLRIMQRTSIVTNATAALTIPSAEVPR